MNKEVLTAMAKDAYATADTVNISGHKAWSMTADERVRQLCMTGTMGRSFYTSTTEQVKDADIILQKADSNVLAKAIVIGRTKGFVRTFNIMGLVYLSQKDIRLFQKVFDQVIITGNDLTDFIDMAHKIRGFGRGVKSTMHRWINKKATPFYAMKYRKQLADGIRISRFKGEKPIYKYILKHYKKELDIKPALEEHPQLKGYEECKLHIQNKEWDKAAQLIKDCKLDPMSVIGAGEVPNNIWDKLAEQMGTMMLVKYLNKLDTVGTIVRHPEILHRINVLALEKARVFPFRLYIAYQNITNHDVRKHLAETLEEYTCRFNWDVYNKFNWVIAPDVSGSMTWEGCNPRPCVVAGMFSGFLYKGLDKSQVLPWDTAVYPTLMGPRSDSVITHINKIETCNGGGTHMELPVNHMILKDIKADIFMLITDNEEWGLGWLNAWIEYKKRNPKAKAILMRVDGYSTQPFSEEDAAKYDIIQIFGYNDNALRFVEYNLHVWANE